MAEQPFEVQDFVPPPLPPAERVVRPYTRVAPRATSTSEDVRLAFRLVAQGVPVSDWDQSVRDAYNAHIRDVRKRRTEKRRQERGQLSVVGGTEKSAEEQEREWQREAFRLQQAKVPSADWPVEVYQAYWRYRRAQKQRLAESRRAGQDGATEDDQTYLSA